MGFLPQTLRGWIGTSIVCLGLAGGTWGSLKLGQNMELWSEKYTDHVTQVAPGYMGPEYTTQEAQKAAKDTKAGLISLFTGIGLLGVGIVVGGIRKNVSAYHLKERSLTGGIYDEREKDREYDSVYGHAVPNHRRVRL
ncbi:hypothetical protein GOV14_05770 [Candidatus Pacearchaeota archaeon]|nr:hypothetical protein [Candidatus Pacearchaeota archaeon]